MKTDRQPLEGRAVRKEDSNGEMQTGEAAQAEGQIGPRIVSWFSCGAASAVATTAILDGFTIRGGNANDPHPDNSGGEFLATNSGTQRR